jgi:hypothetical protein
MHLKNVVLSLSKGVFKSVGAVFGGFLVIVILSVLTDTLLEQIGVLPRGSLFGAGPVLLALSYRIVYSVLGCYVTARLAPNQPMGHALALGLVGVVISAIGSIAARGLAPDWYAWALVLVALPCAWVGGRWALRMKGDRIWGQ